MVIFSGQWQQALDWRGRSRSRARFTRRWSASLVASALLMLTGCSTAPVVWQEAVPADAKADAKRPSPMMFPAPQPFDALLPDSGAISEFARTQDLLREAGAQSMLTSALDPIPESQTTLAANAGGGSPTAHQHAMANMGVVAEDLGHGRAPVDSARCGRSLRSVAVPGLGRAAVWWTRRGGGRVALVAAWRFGDDTDSVASWRGPIIVDTLDQGPGDANAQERGAAGCDRPAPGLAADARSYIHVVYALNAPEGPGVFYAHQMDPRASFEPPQAIIYGDHLGATRVAVSGDVVAVVYEDPNSQSRTQIGLALSTTSGHVFGERIAVSSPASAARDPYVAVRGRALVVGWSDMPSSLSELPTFRVRSALLH